MEFVHHVTPCTSVSYSKLQSLGKIKVSSVSLVYGSGFVGTGCWARPGSHGSGSEEEGKPAKMHWQVHIQLHLLFTRGTQSRKSLARSVQPSYGVLEPSSVPAWHSVLQFQWLQALNRLSPTGKASEREERGTNMSSQGSLWRRACIPTTGHTAVAHLEADCRHTEQGGRDAA